LPFVDKLFGLTKAVLVVDDEEVPRNVVSRYLSDGGHHVVSASGAPEALQKFRSNTFDLVLTDHAMPGMNGAELARTMKEIRTSQRITLLSGFSGVAIPIDTNGSDIDLVLHKPVSGDDLTRAVIHCHEPIIETANHSGRAGD
jgi:CheY-like chemotaxis protein